MQSKKKADPARVEREKQKMEKLITRTIKTTKGVVVGFNSKSETLEVNTFYIGGKVDEDKLISKLKSGFADTDFIPVKVKSFEYEEKLYGMDEETSIKNSKILKIQRYCRPSKISEKE